MVETNMNKFIQMNPNFQLDNFKRIKKAGTGLKDKNPLITISGTRLSFNNELIRKIDFKKNDYHYADLFIDKQTAQIMLMFSKQLTSEYSVKINHTNYASPKAAHYQNPLIISVNLIKEISESFSFLNLENYRYRFLPSLIDAEHGRIIFDLHKRYSATKKAKSTIGRN